LFLWEVSGIIIYLSEQQQYWERPEKRSWQPVTRTAAVKEIRENDRRFKEKRNKITARDK